LSSPRIDRENGAIATLNVDDPALSMCFISKSPSYNPKWVQITYSYFLGTENGNAKHNSKLLLKLFCRNFCRVTILPFGVLNGHAEEYSKPVFGKMTGCSHYSSSPNTTMMSIILAHKLEYHYSKH